ncbi:terminase [Microbacterium excoecariae]|uniref:terminase n=1 Tax=Microbacterium excoecariae TaxID=2715210 RepID=UPI00140A7D47|nr:terminase [Microbacterium excoecariae]NHI16855.1 terminase [Microbacterium excoecariae]
MTPRSPSSAPRPRSAESKPRPRASRPRLHWPVVGGCGQAYVDKVHENDKATPETASKFGSAEPRIATPPLRELTPETSLGFDVIDFADEVLGVDLLPWQRAALIRMLELLEDGTMRFRTVVILVARQNGKSTLAQVLTIWLLCVWGWPLILGTAQDLDVAEALWEEVVDLVLDNDELAPLVDEKRGVTRVNGKKSLNLASGAKYKVKAANRRAGRGLSGNLVLLDELREHQTWDAWGAITKTTMARAEALILALSNAGDATSRVLRYLRLMAHKAVGDPDGINAAEADSSGGPTQFDLETMQSFATAKDADEEDADLDGLDVDDLQQDEETLCLLEWSALPGRDRRDREGWRQANPSLGYTITLRTIAAACKTDPEWIFRTEVLCQWNDGASSGPWEPGSWEETTIETRKLEDGREVVVNAADAIVGPVMAGIGQSGDRSLTYIALAGWRADGDAQIELVAGRYGVDWVEDWLASPDRKGRIKAVTGQKNGAPESTLVKQLKASRTFHMPVVDMDLIGAHANAYDELARRAAWHMPSPVLDLAAQTAERKTLSGGAWVLDHINSPVDIAPIKAWIAALWLLLNHDAEPPPPPPPPKALATDDDEEDDDHDSLTGDLSSVGF